MSSLQPDINCLVCFSPISSKSSGSDQFQEDSFDLLQSSLDIPHLGSILKFSLCCQKCIYNLVEMVDILRGIDELQRRFCQLKDKFKSQLFEGHKCSQDPLGSAAGIKDIFAENRSRLLQNFLPEQGSSNSFTSPPPGLVKFELEEIPLQPESEFDLADTPDLFIPEEIPNIDQNLIQSFQSKSGINLKECEVPLKRMDSLQFQEISKNSSSKKPANVKPGRGRPRKNSNHILNPSISKKRKEPKIALSHPKTKHSWVSCKVCQIKLRNTSLGLHMKRLHPGVVLQPSDISDSEPPPQGQELLNCKLCSFTTDKYRDLASHEKDVHPGSKPYVCTYCQESFPGKYILTSHISQTHLYSEKFQCTTCGKEFQNKNKFKRHSDVHTKGDGDHAKCPKCNESFLQINLEKHMKGCNIIPWICEWCGSSFKRKILYSYHVKKVHEGIDLKKMLCSECPKKFVDRSRLELHIRREHRGGIEKTFSCDKCGKMFQKLTSLEFHLNTHLGIRPFECKICQKRCFSSNALNNHEKIHKANLIPFPCPYCGKEYKLKNYLHGHLYRTKSECSIRAKKEREERKESERLEMEEFTRNKYCS